MFEPDIGETELSGMSRQDLIQKITKHVDLDAVFEELFRMIKRAAVKGYTKQLQTKLDEMPLEQRVKTESQIARMGGFEPYAREEIDRASRGDSGVSILKYVSTNLEPLYKMRTSMETLATAAKRTC